MGDTSDEQTGKCNDLLMESQPPREYLSKDETSQGQKGNGNGTGA